MVPSHTFLVCGGRASDKKITQESYDFMVDRGFTISDDLPVGVKLLIPPFKNKVTGQFTPQQRQYAEYLSVARIHIERAMRAIKENRPLEMEVKMAMLNNCEHIFKAYAYLVNFKLPFLKVRKYIILNVSYIVWLIFILLTLPVYYASPYQ